MEELVFLIRGPRRSARLHLHGPFFVIGRAEPFPVFHDDPTLSREHAAVVATPAGLRLKDLGSRNGVVLNGERLGRYAEVPLQRGDLLQAGDTKLQVVSVADLEAAAAKRAGAQSDALLEESAESITVDAAGRTGFARAVSAEFDDLDEEPGEVTLALDRPREPRPGVELALPLDPGDDSDWSADTGEHPTVAPPGFQAPDEVARLLHEADEFAPSSPAPAQDPAPALEPELPLEPPAPRDLDRLLDEADELLAHAPGPEGEDTLLDEDPLLE